MSRKPKTLAGACLTEAVKSILFVSSALLAVWFLQSRFDGAMLETIGLSIVASIPLVIIVALIIASIPTIRWMNEVKRKRAEPGYGKPKASAKPFETSLHYTPVSSAKLDTESLKVKK